MLPQLREIEARYPTQVSVIGVHTAKFPAERDARHLRAAVEQLGLVHPVVNDADFRVWQAYAVRAWPTLMFIDPEGRVIAKHEGELTVEMLASILDSMIAEFSTAGLMHDDAQVTHVGMAQPAGLLAFPGALVADERMDRLYVADTNHHRILVTSLAGEVVDEIGAGAAGLADGTFASALFRNPQGLALAGDTLFVADTENHAIRAVDLSSGVVTTSAGTGEQARKYVSRGATLETPLNSPWGLTVIGGALYIAMAGNHQIWMYEIGSDETQRLVGTGHEGLRDGAIGSAWLAQPSGLANYGNALLFTDSETSAVRVADVPGHGDGTARTLIGKDLFDFGDIDGGLEVARLQHPLGVAWHPPSATIFVADTYNNKIKRLDPGGGVIAGWLGDTEPGFVDGNGDKARFFEPSGLSVTSAALYIADTNNHAIRRVEIATGNVTTLIG